MMQKSESINNLVKALAIAQTKFDPVLREKENPFFHSKYAELAAVIAATQPALLENGLVIIQLPVSEEGRVGVLTMLTHTSGEFIAESFALPIAKQDAQTGVAAITYARRAAYKGVIGVVDVDDDGNTAAGRNEIAKPQTAPTPRSKPPVESGPEPAHIPDADYADTPLPKAKRAKNDDAPVLAVPATGDELPNEAQLDKYRSAILALTIDLTAAGLKASRNLPASRKILMYLLKSTGVTEAAKISIPQWEIILEYMKKMQATEENTTLLIKTINAASKE